MQIVPLKPLANQQLQCQLGGQAVTLNIYQTAYGLFVDVYVGNTAIILGVIALNLTKIVRSAYLGFIGDLCFYDTVAENDPVYTGLGTQFVLVYLEASEV